MEQVAQLMDDDIIDHLRRSHGQQIVEGQLLVRAAAAPFGAGFDDFDRLRLHLQLLLVRANPFLDNLPAAGKIKPLQPFPQLLLRSFIHTDQLAQTARSAEVQKLSLFGIFLGLEQILGLLQLIQLLRNIRGMSADSLQNRLLFGILWRFHRNEAGGVDMKQNFSAFAVLDVEFNGPVSDVDFHNVLPWESPPIGINGCTRLC
ncbi:hypothetical protein D3C71_1617920 [compost metagenome]